MTSELPITRWAQLTPGEFRVAHLAATTSLRDREIADQLNISLSAVKNRMSVAFGKLGVKNRPQLIWETGAILQ
jgi:DNA-binding CsgD family transcriptional regulator